LIESPTILEPSTSRDATDLAGFGYRQRLDRSLGGFSTFAAGFSCLSILTGLPQLFYLGYGAGGPAFFWTWPTVLAGQFLVALCFAELAAEYPISGGVYQWSRRVGPASVGWMAGWVYLACAAISLASVALALQGVLPQVSPWFQRIGDGSDPADAASNAVLPGCILIAASTIINVVGVRLLARINNVGVFAEMAGAALLIVLLAMHARRGPPRSGGLRFYETNPTRHKSFPYHGLIPISARRPGWDAPEGPRPTGEGPAERPDRRRIRVGHVGPPGYIHPIGRGIIRDSGKSLPLPSPPGSGPG